MSLGSRVRELRKNKGLTQSQLGELVGSDGNTVSRWELDKLGMNKEFVVKFAQALDTSTDYLLLGETDDPKRYTTILSEGPESNGNRPPFNSAAIFPHKGKTILGGDVLTESNVREVEFVMVPVVDSAITVCCGAGTAYAEEIEWNVIGKYPIPTSDLIGYSWQVGDGGFRIITVEGNSMSPRIEDGDQVLFANLKLLNGDLGLVQYRGRYMVRGVFFEGDNIRLQAINKEYEPIVVTQDDMDEFYILGKVLLKVTVEKLNGLW